jgi:hypothetical protein
MSSPNWSYLKDKNSSNWSCLKHDVCVRGEAVLQKTFGAHAGAVVQMRVHFANISKIAVCLVLFELTLFDALLHAAQRVISWLWWSTHAG